MFYHVITSNEVLIPDVIMYKTLIIFLKIFCNFKIITNASHETNGTEVIQRFNEPVTTKNEQVGMYAHRKLRSACASAQSDQSNRWVLYGFAIYGYNVSAGGKLRFQSD